MIYIFTIVIGYVRDMETLNHKIIPPEITCLINYYYKCNEIIVPLGTIHTDESTSSTDELDDSTSEENELEVSTSEENELDEISDEKAPTSFPARKSTKKSRKTKKIKCSYREGSDSDEKDSQEWKIFWSTKELYGRYLPIKELSRGGRSVVFEGKSTWNCESIEIEIDKKVCIKKIRRVFNTDTDSKRLLRELTILRTLSRHESIMQLYDILPPIDPANFKTLTIVFEYVDTDLSKIFKTNQYFSSSQIEYIFYRILLGINYIHSKGIVHRDIRPSNILINADCSIKISDFGFARDVSGDIALEIQKMKKQYKRNHKKKGRPCCCNAITSRYTYRAPEVILFQQTQEHVQKIDMWSIGCIFAELLWMQKDNCSTVWKRGPLFPGDSFSRLSSKDSKMKKVLKSRYELHFDKLQVISQVLGTPTKEQIASINDEHARAYLEHLPKQNPQNLSEMFCGTNNGGINLLTSLLTFDVKERFNATQALQHTYFNRVKNIDLECADSKVKFDFQWVPRQKKRLHQLILHEILYYHPNERVKFEQSGVIKPIKNKKFKNLIKSKNK